MPDGATVALEVEDLNAAVPGLDCVEHEHRLSQLFLPEVGTDNPGILAHCRRLPVGSGC